LAERIVVMAKAAIVTGASSGIGREVTRQLAAGGWRVLAVARREDRLRDMEKDCAGHIIPCRTDLTEEGAPERVVSEADKRLGGLDLLVNNAGTSWVGNLADMPVADLDRVLALNVRALMLMCRAAIPPLRKSKHAQIINVASLAAHLPMETLAVYCASKSAVVAFSRVLAKELAPEGIRVNVFSPCGTDTEIFETVGVEIDRAQLVSAEDMARMLVTMTQLPDGLDVAEIVTHKRLEPL